MGILLSRFGIAPSFALHELSDLDWEFLCGPYRDEPREEGAWADEVPAELENLPDA